MSDAPQPFGLDSVPPEILREIVRHLDRPSLLACLRVRPLHIPAASIVWDHLVIAERMPAWAKRAWDALRRPLPADDAAFLRSLEVLASPAEVRPAELSDVLRNSVGGRLSALGMSLGARKSVQLWTSALGSAPELFDQVVGISLFDVDSADGIAGLLLPFMRMRDFSLTLAAGSGNACPEIVRMLAGKDLRSFSAARQGRHYLRQRESHVRLPVASLGNLGPNLEELRLDQIHIVVDQVLSARSILNGLKSASVRLCKLVGATANEQS
ncbi:hypothetical protein DFJ74DRAFT_732250 [Hyaloraphidium curvatum]|nr:hypothetical protein DFJ74DRAFT_732250 [Hyaloraphidium curvatum]